MSKYLHDIQAFADSNGNIPDVGKIEPPEGVEAPPKAPDMPQVAEMPIPKVKPTTENAKTFFSESGAVPVTQAVHNFMIANKRNYHDLPSTAEFKDVFPIVKDRLKKLADRTKSTALRDALHHFLLNESDDVAMSFGRLEEDLINHNDPMEKMLGGWYTQLGNNHFQRTHKSNEVPMEAFSRGIFNPKGKGFSREFIGAGKESRAAFKTYLQSTLPYGVDDTVETLKPYHHMIGLSKDNQLTRAQTSRLVNKLGDYVFNNYHKPGTIAQRYKGAINPPSIPWAVSMAFNAAMLSANAKSSFNPIIQARTSEYNSYYKTLKSALETLNESPKIPSPVTRMENAHNRYKREGFVNRETLRTEKVIDPGVDRNVLGLAGATNAAAYYLGGKHLTGKEDAITLHKDHKAIDVNDLMHLIYQASPLHGIDEELGGMADFIYDQLSGHGHVPRNAATKAEFIDNMNHYLHETAYVHPENYRMSTYGAKQAHAIKKDRANAISEREEYKQAADRVLNRFENGELPLDDPMMSVMAATAARAWNREQKKKLAVHLMQNEYKHFGETRTNPVTGVEEGHPPYFPHIHAITRPDGSKKYREVSVDDIIAMLNGPGFVYEKQKTPSEKTTIAKQNIKGVGGSMREGRKTATANRDAELVAGATAEARGPAVRAQALSEEAKRREEAQMAAYKLRSDKTPEGKKKYFFSQQTAPLHRKIQRLHDDIRSAKESELYDPRELDAMYSKHGGEILDDLKKMLNNKGFSLEDFVTSEFADDKIKKLAEKVGYKKSLDEVADIIRAKKRILSEPQDPGLSDVVREFAKAQSGPTKKVFPSTVRYAIRKRLYGED